MGNSNDSEDLLELADAITLLRDQIAEAQNRIADPNGGADKGIRFELGEITVELGMELARTNGGNGGLRFSVVGVGVSLGGKHERADKATHKVTVRLNPKDVVTGGPAEVNSRRP
ncbi:trypco2 family protein [Streptomyces sp. NPDC051366]|uniref:trypco2 family protein n=1 Tax=Streptomyces sp. NPDC051366 TaxID=3365652 RepID=UPI0037A1CF50